MKIAITADDTCDLTDELVKENDIQIFHIPVIMGEEEYLDGVSSEKLYDYVDKTGVLPKTAALSSFDYKERFEKLLKDYDAIIHFSLSFGISSTGNNALNASKELENVYVIDTKSLSSGSGLLVLSCVDKIKEKKDIQTIVKELNEEADKIQASFLISKLNYMKKGGRCSSIACFGANLLGIKICIQLVDGVMQATKKYIGKIDSCLSKYLKDIITEQSPNLKRAFVTSSSPMPGVREVFAQEVKKLGFENVYVSNASATISSHCGPNTIGVLYLAQ